MALIHFLIDQQLIGFQRQTSTAVVVTVKEAQRRWKVTQTHSVNFLATLVCSYSISCCISRQKMYAVCYWEKTKDSKSTTTSFMFFSQSSNCLFDGNSFNNKMKIYEWKSTARGRTGCNSSQVPETCTFFNDSAMFHHAT